MAVMHAMHDPGVHDFLLARYYQLTLAILLMIRSTVGGFINMLHP